MAVKSVRLFASFFRIGVMNELQYRANFVIQVIRCVCSLVTGLVGLALVFNYTDELGGWTEPELLAVMGVHLLMGGLIRTAIQPNMERLMDDVQDGTLDFVLTKPADAQLLISVREVRIWQATDIAAGALVLLAALVQMESPVGLPGSLAFIAALFLGAGMIYCFWLIVTTGAFWIIRMNNLLELFQGAYQAGRWPVSIYPDWLRTSLTFLVPVAFAVTVPAQALTQRLTVETLAGSLVFAALLFLLTRWFWRLGMRHYTGASA